MIKGYKISNANEETNGIWLADKSNDTARCLTSDNPDYIWKEWFADLPIDVIVEEIPFEFNFYVEDNDVWADMASPDEIKGRYEISFRGKIRNKISKKLKSQYKKENDYLVCGFKNRTMNFRKCLYVHRLMAQTFLQNPNNKPAVNHINGNKQDNQLLNLEWVTYKENSLHAFTNKLNNNYGETHGNAKLTKQQAESIKIQKGTCKSIAEVYNISAATVCLIKNNKRYSCDY